MQIDHNNSQSAQESAKGANASNGKKFNGKATKPTDIRALSRNGLREIVQAQKGSPVKDQYFALQAIEVKTFSQQDNKKNIKQRLHLSDGTSILIVMITDKYDKVVIPKYSVLLARGNMLVNEVSQRKVLVFREAPTLVYTGLTRKIGEPREFEKNKDDSSYFDREDIDLQVPLDETNEMNQINTQTIEGSQKNTENPESSSQNAQASSSKSKQPTEDQSSGRVDVNKLAEQQVQEILGNKKIGLKEPSALQGLAQSYTPIKSLNTFLFDWKIKARVTKKHIKKTWKNARGQGTLLNVELIDNQGTQIQATFFNEQADHFDTVLEENKVYLFANGQVKMANQRYTSIKNDYSIVFDRNSEIEEADEDASIQSQGFCFTTICQINEFEQMRTIDAIGVITSVGTLTQVNIKQSGAVKDRRNVTIADESVLCITVSLWGQNARMEGYGEGQVFALRGARVSDYNGKSLNSGDEHSQVFIDPDHKRARELKQWWVNQKDRQTVFNSVSGGAYSAIGSISSGVSGTTNGTNGVIVTERPDNFKLAEELISELAYHQQKHGQTPFPTGHIGSNDMSKTTTRFYKISGFVKMIFNDDKILYLSCPDCRKKVIEEDQHWRCENCEKLYQHNLPTYMLSALISDVSGNVMVQFPRELGDAIMDGMSATEFKAMKDEEKDPEKLKEFFHSCTFKQHQILLKVRGDAPTIQSTGNGPAGGEVRQKFFAAKVMPFNIQEENRMLLKRLAIYKRKTENKENGYHQVGGAGMQVDQDY